MIKRTIFFFCLAAMTAGIFQNGYSQQKLTVDKVIANVGNSAILYSEVVDIAAQITMQYQQQNMTSDRDPFYEALEFLLEQKLGYNQAQIDSVTINTSDIPDAVEDMVRMQIEYLGSIQELERMQHMNIYDIRKKISKQEEEKRYAQGMRSEVIRDIKITPGEVESFFRSLPADSIPIIPEQYVYAHIVRFPSKMTDAKQRVRETMLDMREQVINGTAKFATLARLYSLDGSAASGGELPVFGKNEMTEPFEKAVMKLQPGQVSEVVETEYGFHIIHLIEKVGADRYRAAHILMKPQYTNEELGEGLSFLDSLVTEIRAEKITFEDAAMLYSDDASTRMNGGIVNNNDMLQAMQNVYGMPHASQTSFRFKREDFSMNPQDYSVIREMKPGDVSDSFRSQDLRGNALSKIIKLVEVRPTHNANLAEDYLELEAEALGAKRQKAYEEWLTKTIDATYIKIDPTYRKPEMFVNQKWLK